MARSCLKGKSFENVTEKTTKEVIVDVVLFDL